MGRAKARTGTLEEVQVRAMFDRIAGFYDLMNSVMTAGLHHRWRERAADLARLRPGDRALDVAAGTGDLAIELKRRVGPSGEVVGSDFSEGMLDIARGKAGDVRWEWADAQALPYGDDSFSAATVGCADASGVNRHCLLVLAVQVSCTIATPFVWPSSLLDRQSPVMLLMIWYASVPDATSRHRCHAAPVQSHCCT